MVLMFFNSISAVCQLIISYKYDVTFMMESNLVFLTNKSSKTSDF